MKIDRRELLEYAGATGLVATTGTAGCLDLLGFGDDGPGAVPAYSRWITTDSDGVAFYVYLDLVEGGDQTSQEGNDELGEELESDPMFGLPFTAAFLAAFSLFGLNSYGLRGIADDDAEATDFESKPRATIVTNNAVVLTGDIVVEEIDDRLTEPTDGPTGGRFEQTETIGRFDVYTTTSDGDTDAIAVGEDAIVFPGDAEDGPDPVDAIRRPVEAYEGEIEPATAEIDDFQWLLGTAGNGSVSLGAHGQDVGSDTDASDNETDYPSVETADGIVTTLSFSTDSATVSGELATIIDDPDQEELESSLGASADDKSVTVDGERITATATWDDPN